MEGKSADDDDDALFPAAAGPASAADALRALSFDMPEVRAESLAALVEAAPWASISRRQVAGAAHLGLREDASAAARALAWSLAVPWALAVVRYGVFKQKKI